MIPVSTMRMAGRHKSGWLGGVGCVMVSIGIVAVLATPDFGKWSLIGGLVSLALGSVFMYRSSP